MTKFLFVRLSSLGDIARLLPSLQAVRKNHPDYRFDLTVDDRFRGLMEVFPLAERVVPYPRKGPGTPLKNPAAFAGAMQKYFAALRGNNYDIAVDLHGTLRSAAVARFSGAKAVAGYAAGFGKEWSHFLYGIELVPGSSPRMSRFDRYSGALGALGLDCSFTGYLKPALSGRALSERESFLSKAGLRGRDYVIAFLGASRAQSFKRWPADRFVELAALAQERLGMPTLVAWGPDEREDAAGLAGKRGIQLLPETDLQLLIAFIARAAASVGADTGATHISAMLGTPTVAVLGPTDPVLNRPFGDRSTVVRRDGAAGRCGGPSCPHASCIGAITADEVCDALSTLMGRGAEGSPSG